MKAKLKMFETLGIILIVLGLLIPAVGLGIKDRAYSKQVWSEYTATEKAADIIVANDFAEYLIQWSQILVLAGIGFILFDRLEMPKKARKVKK